jgi:hypothetical protein
MFIPSTVMANVDSQVLSRRVSGKFGGFYWNFNLNWSENSHNKVS